MDYKQKMRYQITRRSFVLGLGKLSLSSILLGRLGYLQLVQKDYYRTMSDNNRLTAIMIPPVRGKIMDRKGRVLASNIRKFDIVLQRQRNHKKQREVLSKLAMLMQLGVFESIELQTQYDSNKYQREITLFENVPWFQMVIIEENIMDLPGVFIRDSHRRYYHYPYPLCHILGYVSSLSSEEKIRMKLHNIGSLKIGKRGVEKQYDENLRGEFGLREVETNAKGHIVRELSHEPSKRGRDITLSVDLELHKFVQTILPQEGGGVLVTRVDTGEVLCSVSNPSFDSNLLTQRLSHKQWKELQSTEGNPLINRVVQNLYPPGSVFKVITLLAAMESGVSSTRKIFCSGKPLLGGKSFRCWKSSGHGSLNMHQALKVSCNSYVFTLAKEIGPEKILAMAEKLGFGSLTEIDLPEEVRGFLPSVAWKRRRFKQSWTVGDTLNISVGQGFMLSTLAQIAQMTNIIATKGVRNQLHIGLVKQANSKFINIEPQHLEVIQKAMKSIVNEWGGTAYRSRIVKGKYKFAGKTGTSQVTSKHGENIDLNKAARRKSRNHAVFTGYGPVDNPQFSVSVIVDYGGGGGSIAAPIAKKVFKYLFKHYL